MTSTETLLAPISLSPSEVALIDLARAQGLELVEREDDGVAVWTWQGGRYPTFLERRHALAFMAHRFIYPPPNK